jgi:hypothetical protein
VLKDKESALTWSSPPFPQMAIPGRLSSIFFRSVQRDIRLLLAPEEEVSKDDINDLDITLFDTAKFSGSDKRLTAVTYNNGRYGIIIAFAMSTKDRLPSKIRPPVAMSGAPKILLQKFGDGLEVSKITLSMPHDEIWEATEQHYKEKKYGFLTKPRVLKRDLVPDTGEIGEILETALSMDGTASRRFSATVP